MSVEKRGRRCKDCFACGLQSCGFLRGVGRPLCVYRWEERSACAPLQAPLCSTESPMPPSSCVEASEVLGTSSAFADPLTQRLAAMSMQFCTLFSMRNHPCVMEIFHNKRDVRCQSTSKRVT